ncbi:MAG: DUF4350 domain-containing protein [Bradymonadales bacterium]|jgi:hypothetical protein
MKSRSGVVLTQITFCTLLFAVMTIFSKHALAQPADWRGLEGMLQACAQLGASCEYKDALFGDDEKWHGIIFVGPTTTLPREELKEFSQNGVNILIFDDFGSSYRFLREIGWNIEPAHHWKQYKDYNCINANPNLPVLDIDSKRLNTSAKTIAFNHPLPARSHDLVPLIGAQNAGFYYEQSWIKGKIFFVADASLAINLMLESFDNKLFLRTLLQKTCNGELPCNLRIVRGEFSTQKELAFIEFIQAKYEEYRDQGIHWWDQRKDRLLALPWFALAMGMVIVLLFTMILLFIPFGHAKFLRKH